MWHYFFLPLFFYIAQAFGAPFCISSSSRVARQFHESAALQVRYTLIVLLLSEVPYDLALCLAKFQRDA